MKPPSIKYEKELPKGMDYFFLREEAIKIVQKLSGKIWTDYNYHDPGVTILEQICYALTDISYRTNIDIEKLLFSKGEPDHVFSSNAFFQPQNILPNSPITTHDYKVLFLDCYKGIIKNIWFRKTNKHKLDGLYDILVQPASEVGHEKLEALVKKLYAENRNLCEDIDQVHILKPELIEVGFQIDIDEEYKVEEVLANIFFELDQFFSPHIKTCSFDELRDKGANYEEIFDVPSFENGFIQVSEDAEIPRSFTLSRINTTVSSVKGVRKVRNLTIKKNGIKVSGTLTISHGHFPSLAGPLSKPDITVYKNYNSVIFNPGIVNLHFEQRLAELNKAKPLPEINKIPYKTALSDFGNDYSSIQNTFPVVYGVGNFGLSRDVSEERMKWTRQLQAFILFFDQVLLNHLAQVSNMADLFSSEVTEKRNTYYVKTPDHIPDIEKFTNKELFSDLQNLVAEDFLTRKNNLLNHLLARFGDHFINEEQYKLKNIYDIASTEDLQLLLAKLKSSVLQNIIFLGKDRSKAFNYFGKENAKDSGKNNIYPFKEKVYTLLNIPRKNLGNHSLTGHYDFKLKNRKKDIDKYTFEKRSEFLGRYKTYEKLDSSKFTFLVPSSNAFESLVMWGGQKENYRIIKEGKPGEEKYVVQFKAEKLTLEIGVFSEFSMAEESVFKLSNKFKDYNKKAEGFHVVEQILLRPCLERQYEVDIKIEGDWSMQSLSKDSFDSQQALVRDAILCGTKKENYVVESEESKFKIILCDSESNYLFVLNDIFTDEEEAYHAISSIMVPFFYKLDQSNLSSPQEISYKAVGDYIYNNDFISFNLSLIIPAWVPRFKDPDFQELFHHVLCQTLPAHLKINIVPLRLSEMQGFENLYFKWLEMRREIALFEIDFKKRELEDKANGKRSVKRKDKIELRNKKMEMDEMSAKLMNDYLNKT